MTNAIYAYDCIRAYIAVADESTYIMYKYLRLIFLNTTIYTILLIQPPSEMYVKMQLAAKLCN